jgi:hypothetical protein
VQPVESDGIIDSTRKEVMTVQELIKKLQEFPPETLVRFTADQGHIDTCVPIIEMGDRSWPLPVVQVLFIDIDG